jgi:hypothetical protein
LDPLLSASRSWQIFVPPFSFISGSLVRFPTNVTEFIDLTPSGPLGRY